MKIMQRILRHIVSFFSKSWCQSSDPALVCDCEYPPLKRNYQLIYSIMASHSLDTIDLSEIGLTREVLTGVGDYMTGQRPVPAFNPPEVGHSPSDEVAKRLGELKNYWTQLEDPLDERILNTLKAISILSGDTRGDLSGKYKHLVRISGDDMPQLLDELIDICLLGPKTLIATLRMAITAYTAALARNAKSTISDITTASADLMVITQMIQSQQESFQSSLEHLSHAWNNVASGMTAYTAELDKRTLKLTQLTPPVKPDHHRAPSTASSHTPDASVGLHINITPGCAYKSQFGVLTCCPNGNIGFLANNSDGTVIAKLVEVIRKPRPLTTALNKNLSELINYVKANPKILATYSTSSPQDKLNILNEIHFCIPDLTNQWVKA
ncbi:P [Spodoptera frugiperda rhabdovirus]|uniref:P n=2 Tax=Spodoptera frugiperda rhabdovirus TaxID=1481139 RepID=X2L5J8_9RHAB|nr:P [Spodoptera frugiperda rhabdovirus] [Spodoptera frugiperda rhabdovirus]AHN92644.1 P [Spodoptera frugiperda rhabdovirus] [Spodoptera frugiperda rhabdovirus]ASU89568.1 P [Spodoptera frugiperda rhabdovirus] [Spodoptera frugiperda rhabdovirus]WKD80964.1 P [Spodoptera frugiperda rhabdovirus] [Spodoptera frugiperda rhabdovirus]WPA94107.1 putative phosphoprotein [Spodoptera frugiperda rhabdovirus]